MMPLSLTFRRLIRKYIPQLTNEDIDKYESLLALYAQRKYDQDMINPTNPAKNVQGQQNVENENPADEIYEKALTIIENYKNEYDKVHQLWNATREYALKQGNFHQIPPTLEDGWEYIKKVFNYKTVQFTTLPTLWWNKFKYSFTHLSIPKSISVTVPTGLVILGLVFSDLNVVGKPDVTDIPDQTIQVGESFDPIHLDNYVSDLNNSKSEITWTFHENVELTVKIDTNRVAKVIIPDSVSDWTGSEKIIFKATDPTQLSDSDSATFTVKTKLDSITINR